MTQTVNGTPTAYTQDLAADQSQVLQTTTGSGTPAVTDYLYGLDRLASLPSGGTARTWYMPDLQGSVRYTTDDGANASPTVNYDPYGTPEGGATPPTFGYDGELQDAATGLQYLRARTYNPATGQFLTRDPLEQQTGQAYLYAGGDPVNGSDPSGQCGEYTAAGYVDEPFYGTPGHFCSAADEYLILHDAQSTTSPILYTPTQADKDCLYDQYLRLSPTKRPAISQDAFYRGVHPVRQVRGGSGVGVITPNGSQAQPSPGFVVPVVPVLARLAIKAAAKVAIPLAILFYLVTPGKVSAPSEAPPTTQDKDNPNWVVRAGQAKPQDLQKGYGEHRGAPGIYGISVQYQPGLTVDELAAAGRFPNGQISYQTFGKLFIAASGEGYILYLAKTPGTGFHYTLGAAKGGDIATQLPDDLAAALSLAFERKTNPFQYKRP